MSAAGETNSSPVPGTVFTPRQVRILKVAVIAMGILLVGGFAFVLAAIVYQASRPGTSRAPGEARRTASRKVGSASISPCRATRAWARCRSTATGSPCS